MGVKAYEENVHRCTRSLAKHLKGPNGTQRTHVSEGNGGQKVAETTVLNSITDKGLLLGREAGAGHDCADDLLQQLASQDGGVTLLSKDRNQSTEAADGSVEYDSTFSKGDVVLSEPGILINGADEAFVGTVVATLSKGRLQRTG